MAWYNSSWQYRVKITIASSEVDSTLTDFPVYVDLSDLPSDFHTNVKSDAGDIRVTRSDGTTECAREVVSYDSSTDTGELHFKANSLSSSSNTDFYIYYGNSGASDYATDATYGAENVWTEYEAVWHMQEDPSGTAPQILDSTSNGNDMTSHGSMTGGDLVSGFMGKGLDLDGTDDYVIKTLTTSWNGNFTLTLSASLPNDQIEYTGFFANQDGGGTGSFQIDFGGTDGSYGYDGYSRILYEDNGNKVTPIALLEFDGFHRLGLSYNGSVFEKYYDGTSQGTQSTSTAPSFDVYKTINRGTNRPLDGIIDEYRLAKSVLGDSWVSSEFTNLDTPTTFYTIGSQEAGTTTTTKTATAKGRIIATETQSVTTKGLIEEETPEGWYSSNWDYRIKITVESSEVDSTLTDFPVYVDLSDLPSGFHTNVKSDGGDIRVTQSDGETECAREVVNYDSSTDTGELHFKANGLSSSSNTDFYIYYGNSSASDYSTDSAYGAETVWSDFYRVYHFEENVTDSSGNHSSTNNGSTDTSGKIERGRDFDGTDDYVTLGGVNVTDNFAIEFYVNPDDNTESDQRWIATTSIHAPHDFIGLRSNSGSIQAWDGDEWISLGISVSTGSWQHCFIDYGTASGGSITVNSKVDGGTLQSSTHSETADGLTYSDQTIGHTYGNSYGTHADFQIDEFRIHKSSRSEGWMDASYTNQNTPTTFYTVGSQETGTTTTTKTATTKANILGTAERTATAKSRIQRTNITSGSATGRVKRVVQPAGNAKARIQTTKPQTISAIGLVEKIQTKSGMAKARLSRTINRTLTTGARVKQTESPTSNALGNILAAVQRTATAQGRVSKTQGHVADARANIKSATTRTSSAKGLLYREGENTIFAHAAIKKSVGRISTTRGRIQRTIIQIATSKGFILQRNTATSEARGRIERTTSRNLTTLGRIENINMKTATAQARMQETNTQTASATGKIKQTETQTLTSSGNIRQTATTTADATGRIQEEEQYTTTARSRIQKSPTTSAQVEGRILNTETRTGETGATIRHTTTMTVQASGYLVIRTAHDTTATARIGRTEQASATAKGNIESITVTQTAFATAHILRTIFSVTAKGRIETAIGEAKPALNNLRLPFPDGATISPVHSQIRVRHLDTKDTQDLQAHRYQYKLVWKHIRPNHYDKLEAEVSKLTPMEFRYTKWPQSRNFVTVLGELSPRKLVYGSGDKGYLSSVALTLTEVEPR